MTSCFLFSSQISFLQSMFDKIWSNFAFSWNEVNSSPKSNPLGVHYITCHFGVTASVTESYSLLFLIVFSFTWHYCHHQYVKRINLVFSTWCKFLISYTLGRPTLILTTGISFITVNLSQQPLWIWKIENVKRQERRNLPVIILSWRWRNVNRYNLSQNKR